MPAPTNPAKPKARLNRLTSPDGAAPIVVEVPLLDTAGNRLGLPALSLAGLTGGGATKLDGQVTVGLAANTVLSVVIANAISWWQLQAGAAGGGDVAPADYDAGTNNVKWVKVGGF